MKKGLQNLLNRYSDKIEEVSDESRSGDGYWLYLKPGWQRGNVAPSLDEPILRTDGTVTGGSCSNEHQVHEWSMGELSKAMRSEVFPCQCWDCLARMKNA
jgi:hypothetical protein